MNTTEFIETVHMMPDETYCKRCEKVTPHREKLDAMPGMVCNVCDIINEITNK